MHSLLSDLLDHQAWADAEHWRAIDAHPPAHDDRTLRERVHHVALVQRFFAWMVGDRAAPPDPGAPLETLTHDDLRAFTRASHDVVARARAALDDARLAEPIEVPHLAPLRITRAEALTQMAMHSQWHRGQNATRLRALGAVPPTVDLVVWYAQGRPVPRWEDAPGAVTHGS